MPENELIYFVLISSIFTIIALIRSNNPLIITLLGSSFSMFTVILYLVLDAPDVAMTEASVGIIGFALLILAISKVGDSGFSLFKRLNPIIILFCILLATLLIYAAKDMPAFGSPIFNEYYLTISKQEIGIPSAVASILASYRGYDTFLETLVVIIGMIAAIVILDDGNKSKYLDDPLFKIMSRILSPILLIFALYIQSHGEISPGGGFQAGAIIATMFIIYAISYGSDAILSKVSVKQITTLAIIGIILYLSVGLLGFYNDFEFLNYNYLLGQKLSIIIVEFAVAIAVSASFLAIYLRINNAKSL